MSDHFIIRMDGYWLKLSESKEDILRKSLFWISLKLSNLTQFTCRQDGLHNLMEKSEMQQQLTNGVHTLKADAPNPLLAT